MWEQLKRVIKPNWAIVLFGSEPFSSALRMSNIKQYKYDWIWKKDTKSNFPQASFQPLNYIEMIHVFSSGFARNFPEGNKNKDRIMPYIPQMFEGKEYKIPKESSTTDIFKINHKNGRYKHKEKDTKKRYPSNVLEFSSVKGTTKVHPTQKPVALIEYLVKTYTHEWETVLDFTIWSGTTAIACQNTNRNFIWFELDEWYYNIANKRIQDRLSEK